MHSCDFAENGCIIPHTRASDTFGSVEVE